MNLKNYLQQIFPFIFRRQTMSDLPYVYRTTTKYEPPQLEVKYPCAEAASVGYAEAMRLPYEIAGVAWDYPQGTLVVQLSSWNETIATGYANAIELPRNQREFQNESVCASSGAVIPKPNVEAISENLDKFLQIDSEYEGALDYQTAHGLRSINAKRPEHNQFLVTKKGDGFARPRNLPYLYFPAKEGYPPELIVEDVCAEAREAGYVRAVKLPYFIRGEEPMYPTDEEPEGTLIVYLTTENELIATGYANAVLLPVDRNSIYIEKIDMLDTEYAAMLLDDPRF